MEDEPDEPGKEAPASLMPYEAWTEQAMRHVAVQALRHVAQNGLPGEHLFYITFRTDHPGSEVPSRLKAQYPEEMTIVLQHQFWDLVVADEPGQAADGSIRIGLSFGGVPSTLVIPIAALTAFADPHARFGARFGYAPPPVPGTPDDPEAAPTPLTPEAAEPPQVVSLDAFRRRTPPRET